MTKFIVFVVLSAGWAYVSRASLTAPRSHGFYRFFAVECILALLVLNFESFQQWGRDPLSVRQLVSWFLLVASAVPLALGVPSLRTLAGMRLAKGMGALVLGLCNVVGSTVARESDRVIYTQAGPEVSVASTKAMCSQLTLFLLLALYWGRLKGTLSQEVAHKRGPRSDHGGDGLRARSARNHGHYRHERCK